MRITVNLSLFFHDHRSLARLFISENIKSIKDVKHRIKQIFKIDKFYLKCENQYLPPSEDARILNSDDVVWVIPKIKKTLVNENDFESPTEVESRESPTEQHTILERKKKKKKKEHKNVVITEDVGSSLPNKRRKCNDTERIDDKKEISETNSQNSQGTNNHIKSILKRSKSKSEPENKLLPDTVSEHLISKDSGRESLDSSKSDETEIHSQGVSVKSLVYSFERDKKLQFLKNVSTPIQERKVNIVKTIIVSNDKYKTCPAEDKLANNCELAETENEASMKLDSSQSVGEDDRNTETTDHEVNPEPQYKDNYCDNANEELTSVHKKRQRKRTRKRKSAAKNNDSQLKKSDNNILNLVPRPLLTTINSERHIRFKKDPVIPSSVVNATSECINNNESADIQEGNCKNVLPEFNDISKVINENELTEEFILKQPVMTNIQPRLGDIIGFKILRISENYTPEVSDRIVGKVSCFNSEKSEVTFDTIYGQEQYLQPQGKFSLDIDEEQATEEKTDNSVFQCAWSSILDPRLLYP